MELPPITTVSSTSFGECRGLGAAGVPEVLGVVGRSCVLADACWKVLPSPRK